MAKLRRTLWGRSTRESVAPDGEDLGTDPTDPTDPTDDTIDEPAAPAGGVGDVDPQDGEPDAYDGTEPARAADVEDPTDVEPADTIAADDEAAPVPTGPLGAEIATEGDSEDATEAADAGQLEYADPEPAPVDDLDVDANPVVEKPRRGLRGSLLVSLVQASHAKQAITTALVVGGVAALSGRSARESGVVILAVLSGQLILGWHNDIVDRDRDQRHETPGKPLADGRIEAGTAWYAIAVAACFLVPLSITTGIFAGCLYMLSVVAGLLGNLVFRTGVLSFWSWAVSFGLIPFYLSYGGWGGQALGSAPEPAIVVLAALLGIGVHFTRSVWGLVADHEDGWTYLPLRLAMKVGATRLLAISTVYNIVVVVGLLVFGAKVGLSR